MAEALCSEDAAAEVESARLFAVSRKATFAKTWFNQVDATQSEQVGSAVSLRRSKHNGVALKVGHSFGDLCGRREWNVSGNDRYRTFSPTHSIEAPRNRLVDAGLGKITDVLRAKRSGDLRRERISSYHR